MSWWQRLTNKARGVFGSAAKGGGCDHSSINLRQGTAEFEWFVAKGELETARDLKHGAGHLANLLTYDPGNPEWVELLDQYLAAAGPDPEGLIPRGDKLYYGTEAVRAYIWQKAGRLAEAVDLLVQVTNAKPGARYLDAWALPWLEPPGAVEFLPENDANLLFAVVLNRFPEARSSPLPRLRVVRRWADLNDRCARVHPPTGAAVMMRVGLLRKAGRFDDAVSTARAALAAAADWHTATALGLTLREQGDLAGADEAFRLALRADPKDVSARLEAGDMYLDRGHYEPALRWYDDALKKQPGHPWAQPSALFCRWKIDADQRVLDQLVSAAKAGNDRANALCWREFYGSPPEPTDATANILRQFRDSILNEPEKAPSGACQLTISSLEAPSNYLAFRLEMAALGSDLSLAVTVERVPEPDPRRPLGDMSYLLWTYTGTDASPGLPAPPADVTEKVAAIAAARYEPDENWAAASRVAEELGPARVGEVLACMVHPPPCPPGTPALTWLPRVQMACTAVAAQVDEGWDGSARREALLSVLHGPRDWATEAAITVLGRLGRENEAFAPDIHDAFQKLADARPDAGHWGWVRPLYTEWLTLQHLFPDERKALEGELRRLEQQDNE
jgi:tetratricopeptide (TPR) repeat protein